jgi:hypothetical protein
LIASRCVTAQKAAKSLHATGAGLPPGARNDSVGGRMRGVTI